MQASCTYIHPGMLRQRRSDGELRIPGNDTLVARNLQSCLPYQLSMCVCVCVCVCVRVCVCVA